MNKIRTPEELTTRMQVDGVGRLRRIYQASNAIAAVGKVLGHEQALEAVEPGPSFSPYIHGGLQDAVEVLGDVVAEQAEELLSWLGKEPYEANKNEKMGGE